MDRMSVPRAEHPSEDARYELEPATHTDHNSDSIIASTALGDHTSGDAESKSRSRNASNPYSNPDSPHIHLPKNSTHYSSISPDVLPILRKQYDAMILQGSISPDNMPFSEWAAAEFARERRIPRPQVDADLLSTNPMKPTPMILKPKTMVKGDMKAIVLLVDFPGLPHKEEHTTHYYMDLLFSPIEKQSMRYYYGEVSQLFSANEAINPKNTGVNIHGEVHGWFTMPHPMDYYVCGEKGIGPYLKYPKNAKGLITDAIAAAVINGVTFGKEFDTYNQGLVTSLFVIHSGNCFEQTWLKTDFHSHQSALPYPINAGSELKAYRYLLGGEHSPVGLFIHESGHLMMGWADYYDRDVDNTGIVSEGLGGYCLLSAGQWGNHGNTPVYPNCMLRAFHDWVDVIEVTGTGTWYIEPVVDGGKVLRIRPDGVPSTKYLMVECRRQEGWDRNLPDSGVAIYVIDESTEDVDDEDNLAIELMQADGRRELNKPGISGNSGDQYDLYPSGTKGKLGYKNKINNTTKPRLVFPGTDGKDIGVSITVQGRKRIGQMQIDVVFKETEL